MAQQDQQMLYVVAGLGAAWYFGLFDVLLGGTDQPEDAPLNIADNAQPTTAAGQVAQARVAARTTTDTRGLIARITGGTSVTPVAVDVSGRFRPVTGSSGGYGSATGGSRSSSTSSSPVQTAPAPQPGCRSVPSPFGVRRICS